MPDADRACLLNDE